MTTKEKVQSLIDSGKTCVEAVAATPELKKETVQWYYSQLSKGKAKPENKVVVKVKAPAKAKTDKSMSAKEAVAAVFNQGLTLKQALEILPEINQATVKKIYYTLKKKDNGK